MVIINYTLLWGEGRERQSTQPLTPVLNLKMDREKSRNN
jgi:hypothetical protein